MKFQPKFQEFLKPEEEINKLIRGIMGKKLNMLLGKSDKSSKIRTLSKLTLLRIAFLKKQYQARLSQERSNVVELLRLGRHDRALLRVELVMKDQSMLDALSMIEGYCEVLVERATLIKKHVKECPEELKEAASSLIFAASRCGELPELHEIRGVITKLYGKEYAARVVGLRSGCGVNPRIIRKLSTRTPSLESRRQKMLGEIASQSGITLPLQNANKVSHLQTVETDTEHEQAELNLEDISQLGDDNPQLSAQCFEDTGSFPEAIDLGTAYQDTVAAAQDAFLSAAFAAAAARAAVELSRLEITSTV